MKAMSADRDKRYQSADAMLMDLEKFRKDPSVDLDYIRTELTASVDSQPTSPIPVQKVSAAVKSRQAEDEDDEEEEDGWSLLDYVRENKKLVGLLAAGLAVIILVFVIIFAGFGSGGSDKAYKVPNILGYTVEEANQLETVKDIFTIEVVGTLNDDHFQPGQIVQQDPADGVERRSNFVIQVYVCAERQETTMPNLQGMDYQSAKLELQQYDLKLNVMTEERFSDEFPSGQVMETTPAVGAVLKKGASVTLVVSKGPESVTVPDFTKKSYEKAKAEAEQLGLKVGSPEYQFFYPFADEGDVIDQSIQPGTSVPGGTEIIFTVYDSRGSQERTVRVEFLVPDDLSDEDTLRVEFLMDDQVVDTRFISGDDATVSFDYTGKPGTSATVYARINGVSTASQEIDF